MSAFNPGRVQFHSTGSDEGDAREAARIRKQLAHESEGLCPNGCAPLTWPERDDVAECPVCGFIGVGMTRATYDPTAQAETGN